MLIVTALDVLLWMIVHPWAGVPLAITARLVYVHFKPYRTCRWCRNKRRRKQHCWRCKGTRLTRRLGAYHVHKAKLSLIQAMDEWRDRP